MITKLIKLIKDKGIEVFNRYYSIYPAIVVNTVDPEQRNRLRVYCPSIHLENKYGDWANSCSYYSGKGYGIQLLPEIGDMVYVKFLYGDYRKPVWLHGGYGIGELPGLFKGKLKLKGIYTKKGHFVYIDEESDVIAIEHKDGHIIRVSGDSSDDTPPLIALKLKSERQIVIKDDVITFDEGTNGEFIKINELVGKLNKVEEELNTLKNLLSSWVPVPNDGGAALKSITSSWSTTPITTTTKEAIMNDKIKH